MVNESVQQYRDYYESDAEEEGFFEYLDNLANRDKIRFMEIFEDYTVDKLDHKNYIMIEKREHNPELSVFSNMVLDLIDFKDRVRPLSNDIALMEQANRFQKQNVDTMLQERADFNDMLEEIHEEVDEQEGSSSGEIPEPRQKLQSMEAKQTDDEVSFEADVAETVEEPKKEE